MVTSLSKAAPVNSGPNVGTREGSTGWPLRQPVAELFQELGLVALGRTTLGILLRCDILDLDGGLGSGLRGAGFFGVFFHFVVSFLLLFFSGNPGAPKIVRAPPFTSRRGIKSVRRIGFSSDFFPRRDWPGRLSFGSLLDATNTTINMIRATRSIHIISASLSI